MFSDNNLIKNKAKKCKEYNSEIINDKNSNNNNNNNNFNNFNKNEISAVKTKLNNLCKNKTSKKNKFTDNIEILMGNNSN